MSEQNQAQQVDALGNKPLRGFAAMSKEAHRESARKGGLKAQANGRAHRYNSETGRVAGSKGGKGGKGRSHAPMGDIIKSPSSRRRKGLHHVRTPEELAKRIVVEGLIPKESGEKVVVDLTPDGPYVPAEPPVSPELEVKPFSEGEAVERNEGEVGGPKEEDFERQTLKELLVPENAELLKQCMTEVGEEMLAAGEPKLTYQANAKVEDWMAGASGPIEIHLTPAQEALLAELQGAAEEDRDL